MLPLSTGVCSYRLSAYAQSTEDATTLADEEILTRVLARMLSSHSRRSPRLVTMAVDAASRLQPARKSSANVACCYTENQLPQDNPIRGVSMPPHGRAILFDASKTPASVGIRLRASSSSRVEKLQAPPSGPAKFRFRMVVYSASSANQITQDSPPLAITSLVPPSPPRTHRLLRDRMLLFLGGVVNYVTAKHTVLYPIMQDGCVSGPVILVCDAKPTIHVTKL